MRILLPAAIVLTLAAPALAQQLPPAAEKYLYCAEVIFWFGEGVGDNSGDAKKQAEYDRLAQVYNRLAQAGVDTLTAAGWSAVAAEDAVHTYADEVITNWADNLPMRWGVPECDALDPG